MIVAAGDHNYYLALDTIYTIYQHLHRKLQYTAFLRPIKLAVWFNSPLNCIVAVLPHPAAALLRAGYRLPDGSLQHKLSGKWQ